MSMESIDACLTDSAALACLEAEVNRRYLALEAAAWEAHTAQVPRAVCGSMALTRASDLLRVPPPPHQTHWGPWQYDAQLLTLTHVEVASVVENGDVTK